MEPAVIWHALAGFGPGGIVAGIFFYLYREERKARVDAAKIVADEKAISDKVRADEKTAADRARDAQIVATERACDARALAERQARIDDARAYGEQLKKSYDDRQHDAEVIRDWTAGEHRRGAEAVIALATIADALREQRRPRT